MMKKLLPILLCLSMILPLTGFMPASKLALICRKQPVKLVNGSGDILFEGNYFRLSVSPSDAAAYPALKQWAENFNAEQETDLKTFVKEQSRDVYTQFENGSVLQYSRIETFVPVRADSAVVSFALADDTYLGGAHGYRSFKGVNIDPSTGEPLSFSDIIADTESLPEILFWEVLVQSAEDDVWSGDLIRDQEAYEESPERKAFCSYVKEALKNDAAALAWALDTRGVRFWFDDYCMGVYAAGSRECRLAFEEYPDLFTDAAIDSFLEYSDEEGSPAADSDAPAVRMLSSLRAEIMDTYGYDAARAYAEFLSDYMEHPLAAEESSVDMGSGDMDSGETGDSETDVPSSAEDVLFAPIYLDGDDIPELAVANGTAPWNPVHLLSYDPAGQTVSKCGEFSMYGKMYYIERTGIILPVYYIPAMFEELYLFDRGSVESYTLPGEPGDPLILPDGSGDEPAFTPVFSEFRPMLLSEYPGGGELREALERAAGISYISDTLSGLWQAEGPAPAEQAESSEEICQYLEITDDARFAIFDENGYVMYMGAVFETEERDPHGMRSYEFRTMDGGLFEMPDWYTADDPLNDRVSFGLHSGSFARYTDTGGGTPVRSPEIYLLPDLQFRGEWRSTDVTGAGENDGASAAEENGSAAMLAIDMTNAMSGGYMFAIDFGNGIEGAGFAAPDGDDTLYITQAYAAESTGDLRDDDGSFSAGFDDGSISARINDGGDAFGGIITREDDVIILTITYSDGSVPEEGAVYRFTY